jgi:hypothetical protein
LAIFILVIRPLLAAGVFGAARGFKRDNAQSASRLFDLDARPKVLFLRSYADDRIEVRKSRSTDEVVYGLRRQVQRLEEVLVDVAFRYGPVGALHDPRVDVRPLGAARDVSRNENWREYILGKLDEAHVVIFVLGDSEGLRWELLKASELGLVTKLIFVFPPGWNAEEAARAMPGLPVDAIIAACGNAKPIVLFHESEDRQCLVVSDDQGAASYECGMLLAAETKFSEHASNARTGFGARAETVPPARISSA